jgi:hypothetical protein
VDPVIQLEIRVLLNSDEKQVGQTYRLIETGVTLTKDLVAAGVGANPGVVNSNKQIIKSILDGIVPKSAIMATYTYRVINRLRSQGIQISKSTEDYLDGLYAALKLHAGTREALVHDTETLVAGSEELAKRASTLENAVYVYSFPTYLHFGTIEDPEVKWLKIGSTRKAVWQRIVEQNRQTSMPEDPVLIRIYHAEKMNVAEVESKFHKTLEKVGHERSTATKTKAGKEWFATTEDALDALAELMNLEIESDFDF